MSVDQMIQSTPDIILSKELKDQYADGKAATAFHLFEDPRRTQNYKDTLTGILRQHGCKKVLDAACGTGIDSIMLIEEGFKMVSIDASDQMLKHALKTRWDNRKDPKYDEWVIEEAFWETLPDDIERFLPGTQFDAIICLGNSFPHVLDEYGDQRVQKLCLRNFNKCLKPGGLLFIDHRNYDAMLNGDAAPARSIYYDWKCPLKFETSVTSVNGDASAVTFDYYTKENNNKIWEFRLQNYAHKLDKFTKMLDETFDNRAKHLIYADFKPMDQVPVPAFYIHVIEKEKKIIVN